MPELEQEPALGLRVDVEIANGMAERIADEPIDRGQQAAYERALDDARFGDERGTDGVAAGLDRLGDVATDSGPGEGGVDAAEIDQEHVLAAAQEGIPLAVERVDAVRLRL